MYGVQLILKPSAALTFRAFPGSVLDINTYPFVPPSTLSGWLYRIWRFAHSPTNPPFLETGLKDSPYYYLPPELICLGAYPRNGFSLHRTRRHGTKGFSSTARSALSTDQMEAPQLHTWSYLLADSFVGYVLSNNKAALEQLVEPLRQGTDTLPYGCKLGKEGFAFLESVEVPQALSAQNAAIHPSVWSLMPIEEVVSGSLDFELFNVYKPKWKQPHSWLENAKVDGFMPMALALPIGGYLHTQWWVAQNWQVPQSLVEVLR